MYGYSLPTSCPQSPASCCELAHSLSGKGGKRPPALFLWTLRFGRFLPGSLPPVLAFPLPIHLLRLYCSPPAPPLPPALPKRGTAAPLGSEACPHSLESTFAFSCLLPWTPHLSARNNHSDKSNLEVEELSHKPADTEPRKKVLLPTNPGAPSTLL